MSEEKESSEYPRADGSGSGTDCVWSVEARYNYHTAKAFGDLILDNRWQRLYFKKHKEIGVPQGGCLTPAIKLSGLLSYQAAQALRWWFIANCENDSMFGVMGALCLETRLVKHEVEYSYKVRAIRHSEEILGTGARRK